MTTEIDILLSEIEYPGEDGRLLQSYLDSVDFADRVMQETRRLHVVFRMNTCWMILVLFMISVVVGLQGPGWAVISSMSRNLLPLLYAALGIVLSAAIVGWVFTLNPERVARLLRGRASGMGATQRPSDRQSDRSRG